MTNQDQFQATFKESVIDFSQIKAYSLKNSYISLGSRALNRIVTGSTEIGVVRGRIYEIYGHEGSGKTTLALEAIVSCQKKKGKTMFVDSEHALDIKYAKAIGVNFENILFSQPGTGEEAFEMLFWAVAHGIDLVVVDSVASMVPLAEIEADMDQDLMGVHARLMGKGLRKLTSKLTMKTPTAIIFTNQIRYKIGVVFGNPEVQPGGKALKFWADVRIEIRDPRKGKIVENKVEHGKYITAKTVKNRIFPPYQKTIIPIIYGIGVDKKKDIIQVLVEKELATKTNKTVTIKGMKQINFVTFSKRLDSDKVFIKKIKGLLKQ